MIEHGQSWEDRGEQGWRRVVGSPGAAGDPRRRPPCAALLGAGFVVVARGRRGRARRPRPRTAPCAASRRSSTRTSPPQCSADAGRRPARHRDRRRARRRRLRHARRAPAGPAGVWPSCAGTPPTGHFASGSMGPKVEAACRFVEAGGRGPSSPRSTASPDAVAGAAGTVVEAPEPRTRRRAGARTHRGPQGPDQERQRRLRARRADRRRASSRPTASSPSSARPKATAGSTTTPGSSPTGRSGRCWSRRAPGRRSRSSRSPSCGPAAPTA